VRIAIGSYLSHSHTRIFFSVHGMIDILMFVSVIVADRT
jgi:hypothetical protein